MDESLTKKQLVILETFTQAVQQAQTSDEVAEILLNSLFEAFPGFDEGFVFLPDGQGNIRPVVQRKGFEVTYPSKRFECLAETVAEAELAGVVKRREDGSIVAVEMSGEEEDFEVIGAAEGFGDLGVGVTFPARSRLCVPLEEEGVVHGYIEFGSKTDRLWHFGLLTEEMHPFIDIAASALNRIGTDL